MKWDRDFLLFAVAVAVCLVIGFAFVMASPPPVPEEYGTASPTISSVDMMAMYPDPTITPGAVNPAITQDTMGQTICNKSWHTGSVRDQSSSAAQKNKLYGLYHIAKPANNTGKDQTCELDHLISLELGGSDDLSNIWPECGPANVALAQRFFKEKDTVENYLHAKVCAETMTLDEAQSAISTDWYAVFQSIKQSEHGFGGTYQISSDDPDDNQ